MKSFFDVVVILLFLTPFFAMVWTGVAYSFWGVNIGHWFTRKGKH